MSWFCTCPYLPAPTCIPTFWLLVVGFYTTCSVVSHGLLVHAVVYRFLTPTFPNVASTMTTIPFCLTLFVRVGVFFSIPCTTLSLRFACWFMPHPARAFFGCTFNRATPHLPPTFPTLTWLQPLLSPPPTIWFASHLQFGLAPPVYTGSRLIPHTTPPPHYNRPALAAAA